MWLWYREGMEELETGRGLPAVGMPPEAVLGLAPGAGADSKAVRKAYRTLSLKWHPDRWARLPSFVRLAQDVFEVVGAAHEALIAN